MSKVFHHHLTPHLPKQRLQYPIATQQRKHFQNNLKDHLRIGTQTSQNVAYHYAKHDKMDTSAIEGAKPKIQHLSKQEKRAHSLKTEPGTFNRDTRDELDNFTGKSLHKRQMSLSKLEGSIGAEKYGAGAKRYSNGIFGQQSWAKPSYKLMTQGNRNMEQRAAMDKMNIVRAQTKRSILQNPTYISSLLG